MKKGTRTSRLTVFIVTVVAIFAMIGIFAQDVARNTTLGWICRAALRSSLRSAAAGRQRFAGRCPRWRKASASALTYWGSANLRF